MDKHNFRIFLLIFLIIFCVHLLIIHNNFVSILVYRLMKDDLISKLTNK
jgi:hypothetical protein